MRDLTKLAVDQTKRSNTVGFSFGVMPETFTPDGTGPASLRFPAGGTWG